MELVTTRYVSMHPFDDRFDIADKRQDNHHYANPQCGSPFYSIRSSPYDPKRIALQGEFGGIGQNLSIEQ